MGDIFPLEYVHSSFANTNDSNISSANICYTAHYNWAPIVDLAIVEFIHQLSKTNQLNETITSPSFVNSAINICRQRDLPSKLTIKPIYSLFRVENTQTKVCLWLCSETFGFLDAKDSLYFHLLSNNSEKCMPKTILLPWDINKSDGKNDMNNWELPSNPCLLKAALGSGGFGLYFVDNKHDIYEVIKGHQAQAMKADNFLNDLMNRYGSIPQWSLQEIIRPVQHKIRMKSYKDNNNEEFMVIERNTQEVSELDGSFPIIQACVIDAMMGLKDVINNNNNNQSSLSFLRNKCNENGYHINTMGVAGIDLMVAKYDNNNNSNDDDNNTIGGSMPYFKAYIIELNNNPAMPNLSKRMSNDYKNHIIRFVNGLFHLGLSYSPDNNHYYDDVNNSLNEYTSLFQKI
eukprot:gene8510-11504_t